MDIFKEVWRRFMSALWLAVIGITVWAIIVLVLGLLLFVIVPLFWLCAIIAVLFFGTTWK